MHGYVKSASYIKQIRFPRGKVELLLSDGRVIISPIDYFPEIKKLSPVQRSRYHIIGGVGFDFDDSNEVYHLSDFLGVPFFEMNTGEKHAVVNEPGIKYLGKNKSK